jgi:hypothetical protein
MEEVSGILLTVRRALNDDAAEEGQTLTVADRRLTEVHDALERAERTGAAAPAEPAPVADPVDPKTFLAGVERLKECRETPQGKALAEAEDEVSTGIALLDTAIRSLELDDGNERETMVLSLALKRLEAAQNHLDTAGMALPAAREVSP